MWGDKIWLSRFTDSQPPRKDNINESITECETWQGLKQERKQIDERISQWVWTLSAADFEGDLSWYSGAIAKHITRPRAMLIMQLFNHQTHHRGQVHAMLTAAGVKPDNTDIPFIPEAYLNQIHPMWR